MGRTTLLCTAVVILFAPPGLSAQVPGQEPRNPVLKQRADHAKYVKRVTKEIEGVLATWSEAWESRDFRRLAGHYSDRARMLQIPGRSEPLWPESDSLTEALRRHLPDVENVEVAVVTADASRELAYISGRYEYRVRGSRSGAAVSGKHVFVFRRSEDGDWRIRSHLFRRTSPGS